MQFMCACESVRLVLATSHIKSAWAKHLLCGQWQILCPAVTIDLRMTNLTTLETPYSLRRRPMIPGSRNQLVSQIDDDPLHRDTQDR